jgi:S1-C subfamily serine protease
MVFERVSPLVFVVRTRDFGNLGEASGQSGSAVAIAPGILVTNRHVVRDAWSLLEVSRGPRTWPAYPAFFSHDDDLCFLRVPGLESESASLKSPAKLRVGDPVFAVGSPQGLELTLSDGLISALRGSSEGDEGEVIQTTAPVSPGSSGGGLFDRWGQLVGITTWQLSEGQSLNFAIPTDAVAAGLSKTMGEGGRLFALGLVRLELRDRRGGRDALHEAVRVEPGLAEAWIVLAHATPLQAGGRRRDCGISKLRRTRTPA